MPSPDCLDIVPEHVADPVRRASWRVRLKTGCGDALLSLVFNGAVVAGLIGVGWPSRPVPAPSAISVELVDHMPEVNGAGPAAAGSPSPESGTPAGKDEAAPSSAAKPDAAHTDPKPAAPPPAPAKDVPENPAPEPPASAPEPSTAQDMPPSPPAAPNPEPHPAVPPPADHPDNDPQPRLVEAPLPPSPVQDSPDTTKPAAAAPAAPESATGAADTPAQRPVIAAPEDAEAVPPPAPPPDKPLTAEEKRQAENTAKLAAMLPFGSGIAASPFQAPAPSQNQGTSTAYRGLVYANFNKARDVIEEAKAKHLKGQAVVAFTVDDRGGLAALGIAVSSGNPAVDAAALDLIRRAAPFPPPPPGVQRSFSPAIGLGLDD